MNVFTARIFYFVDWKHLKKMLCMKKHFVVFNFEKRKKKQCKRE